MLQHASARSTSSRRPRTRATRSNQVAGHSASLVLHSGARPSTPTRR
jgi:hypothetical protein